MPELIVKLKGRELQRLPITRPVFHIGRDPAVDVVIDNPSVSRLHAAVSLEGGVFVLRDKDSANGIYVQGERRRAHVFRHGDEVQVGKFTIGFDAAAGPSAAALLADPDEQTIALRKFLENPDETTHLSAVDLHKALAGSKDEPVLEPSGPPTRERQLQDRLFDVRRQLRTARLAAMGFGALSLLLAVAVIWLAATR